jgi:hypothetical protein
MRLPDTEAKPFSEDLRSSEPTKKVRPLLAASVSGEKANKKEKESDIKMSLFHLTLRRTFDVMNFANSLVFRMKNWRLLFLDRPEIERRIFFCQSNHDS